MKNLVLGMKLEGLKLVSRMNFLGKLKREGSSINNVILGKGWRILGGRLNLRYNLVRVTNRSDVLDQTS